MNLDEGKLKRLMRKKQIWSVVGQILFAIVVFGLLSAAVWLMLVF